MNKKFETVMQILSNPPEKGKKLLNSELASHSFDAAQEMDEGARIGLTLISQWLESKSETDAVERVDALSTVALSLFSYKKILGEMENYPEELRDKMIAIKSIQEMAKMDKEAVLAASLHWISGFLFGLAFYRDGIASTDEES